MVRFFRKRDSDRWFDLAWDLWSKYQQVQQELHQLKMKLATDGECVEVADVSEQPSMQLTGMKYRECRVFLEGADELTAKQFDEFVLRRLSIEF